MEENEGEYWIQTTRDPNAWQVVPMSERVFCDGGAVIFYDEHDKVIAAYGPGQWVNLLRNDALLAMNRPADYLE